MVHIVVLTNTNRVLCVPEIALSGTIGIKDNIIVKRL